MGYNFAIAAPCRGMAGGVYSISAILAANIAPTWCILNVASTKIEHFTVRMVRNILGAV
jgi:hypothetical protein